MNWKLEDSKRIKHTYFNHSNQSHSKILKKNSDFTGYDSQSWNSLVISMQRNQKMVQLFLNMMQSNTSFEREKYAQSKVKVVCLVKVEHISNRMEKKKKKCNKKNAFLHEARTYMVSKSNSSLHLLICSFHIWSNINDVIMMLT